ncbi:hypothetical protein TIFTF001_036964 [Ficus carica]|uniref:Uncharacterized protein n=1 Tax=Ficus carica TaxID=3494 RepID=A0AA88E594_FICCA|nr:hypothetical protein TIFTF001_036964 [Ficus carica]
MIGEDEARAREAATAVAVEIFLLVFSFAIFAMTAGKMICAGHLDNLVPLRTFICQKIITLGQQPSACTFIMILHIVGEIFGKLLLVKVYGVAIVTVDGLLLATPALLDIPDPHLHVMQGLALARVAEITIPPLRNEGITRGNWRSS